MADYLSRAAYREEDNKKQLVKEMYNLESNFFVTELNSISSWELIKDQEQDEYCKNIKGKLESGFVFSENSPKFFLREGLLLCLRNSSDRHKYKAKLVVPRSKVLLVLKTCHDSRSVAHAGFSRTLKRIKEKFFWQNFYKDVKNYVASCHECISRRGFSKNQKAPVQRVPLPNFPFEKVGIDAIGPFVTSIEGNKHLIVMTDYFTKYAEVYPVKDIQSSTVCKVLIDFISRHGIMRVLYSDRGSNFISVAMQEVYELLGISKQQCLSYSPQGNGAVERLNKTLVNALSHLVSFNQTDWCQQVPLALMAYRNAHHRSIDEKPSFLVNGRDLIMPADFIYAEPVRSYSDTLSYRQEVINRLHNTFALVKSNLEKSAEEISKNVAPLPKNKLIEVGNVVYLNTPKIKIHSSKKLSKLNEGPFRVITKHSPVIFEIKHLNKPENVQKVHLNRIFKVPERAIFEWESPSNAELETTVDVSPTSVQRLPSEEEILKEFPPYTLPLEMGNFLEEENYENQGINLPSSGEELSEVPEPVVEIQNGEGELVLIPSESNEHQLSSCEEVVGMQTCNSDNSGVIHEGSVSGDTEGNTQTENSWSNRLRPRDRSGFVKK
ncbi:hypothetical protein CDAR_370541 [Caerostris darwini]|uniref:RNA-directed DNA polymerase n=1 Tax=Caerostris darwini TaxID=1538125 RepID=A0AAV4VFI7_9ARAC|nr:hypothetical protein CDAR_370541 [Caerostris darwini]